MFKMNLNRNYGAQRAPKAPNWAKTAVIYEVNTRQYTPEGTFRAFEAHLPRLKKLGVTVLWFMPIHPIGVERRKGRLGSYYSVRDYLNVNPEFGTLNAFKRLVRKIHDMGMRVIIDWVANHSAWDNPILTAHPQWFRRNKAGEIVSPLPDWSDVADLNYNETELRRYMTDAMLFWVRETDIDGFRCDVAEMVPTFFWKKAIHELRKIKPVLMLAEGQHPSLHVAGFHLSYAFNMYRLFNDIAAGLRSPYEIDKWLEIDRCNYPSGAMRLRYTCNHDQNSWTAPAVIRLGDAARVLAALTFTLPGTPLIYSGQEAGLSKSLAFFDKDTIDWQESPWFGFYQALCNVRRRNPALHGGTMVRLPDDNPEGAYSFVRQSGENQVLVAANLSTATVNGSIPSRGWSGTFIELFDNTRLQLGDRLDYSLPPWAFRIYLRER